MILVATRMPANILTILIHCIDGDRTIAIHIDTHTPLLSDCTKMRHDSPILLQGHMLCCCGKEQLGWQESFGNTKCASTFAFTQLDFEFVCSVLIGRTCTRGLCTAV